METTQNQSIHSIQPTDVEPGRGVSLFLSDSLPPSYYKIPTQEVWRRGDEIKRQLGKDVLILAHHYQREETFYFGDVTGDSLYLAQVAAKSSAKYIIFCGVHFMAESADIVTKEEQKVILPNITAGCSMADMADIDSVKDCWEHITEVAGEDQFIPITYINSSASLKAFCGKHGGTVCTSSNAPKILKWAFDQNKTVLFFPDQHLGRNTANTLNIDKKTIHLWDRKKDDGGLSDQEIEESRVILWDGFCSIHNRFSVDQIKAARKRRPNIKIISHPECPEDVIAHSDYMGSTNYIIDIIKKAEPNTEWAVGTEVNLVTRLHKELNEKEGKIIECLNPNVCLCSTMYRTNPANILYTLENIQKGNIQNQISVPIGIAKYAKIALDRMLELS